MRPFAPRACFCARRAGLGLADCLRATIGVAEDVDIAAGVLERWAEGEKT